ncbi:MAG TPA: hypothetical protein PKU86_05665 [Bacteroidales bacterium]|jgi:hypothetical protein|nr:hypothetical protein [Bacteroidales bacterium]HQQ01877.1 hypothetical protein [Bacteroidales bacterium]
MRSELFSEIQKNREKYLDELSKPMIQNFIKVSNENSSSSKSYIRESELDQEPLDESPIVSSNFFEKIFKSVSALFISAKEL